MTAVVDVNRGSTTFMRTNVVDNVSVTIESDEVHALPGQSGPGEPTPSNILSRYHRPDPAGGVRIQVAPLSLRKRGRPANPRRRQHDATREATNAAREVQR